jgi:Right handed beta helix region
MFSLPRLLAMAFSLALAFSSYSVIYYVSPTGSDSNNGTSQATPWKTIDRVNQGTYVIVPGDQVLFQRGGTYRGEIIWGVSGTAAQPVTYGAYGTGVAPIISGAKVVTTWTAYSGNIWKATVGQLVEQVYVGGVRMTLARWPNTDWARNTQGTNNTMQSNSITQGSGYFTGARCVLRSTASSIDTLRITNHTGSTLTFGYNPTNTNMGADNWGFFIEKKLSLLDAANEWFYDPASGQLYLWAPGGVNPNTLSVEASVYYSGVNCYPDRQYGVIQDLSFRNQRYAGVHNGSASHVTVTGCIMEDLYHGIRSYGFFDNYSNNTIRRTYATGCILIDENSLFSNNTLTDIALIPGQGETSWGYFGVRSIGPGNIIRGNRFTNIGYTAVEAGQNTLVEKNSISNYTVTLNDGGGINFDHADGLIIQDNVVRDPVGGLDGSATNWPHYQHLGVGIYFGNTSIVNSLVQRNHLYNILGVGINVDHCMNSVNLKIKDNVIFNAGIGLSISDYSNRNGPFAVSPFYVANYNDEFTGNTIYALGKDKLCMRFYNCNSPLPVDFGTFANNKYYAPYNELCIFTHNLTTTIQRFYSLEEWQVDKNEDAGSSRSPMRQTEVTTTGELSGNLVPNGDFTTNTTGWGGWPTNAQVTRITTNLDNGCLKAYLPNNSVATGFALRNPDWFSLTNGQWYRMRISLQSNAEGLLRVGLKAQSTLSDPYAIGERFIPFGTERRDLEIYFQSNITDVAQIRLINEYTEPTYYMDNVDVRRVNVQTVAPLTLHSFFVNDLTTAQNFTVPAGGCWKDMAGNTVAGGSTFTLQSFTSRIFYKVPDNQCVTQPTNNTVGAKVLLGGAVNWTTFLMRDDLRAAGLVPNAEPYTAYGWALENAGATIAPSVLSATGNSAIVDWVVMELKSNDQTYSAAARRACLVQKDGTVISPDGNPIISFTTTTSVGKYVVIHHRNHLGVMSVATVATNGQVIDFTQSTTATYGTEAQQVNGTRRALWCGNVNSDVFLKYTGLDNDRDPQLSAIGSTVPTNMIAGYLREDVNMDGLVKYIGTSNDRDIILVNIGGTIPTTVRAQQVP